MNEGLFQETKETQKLYDKWSSIEETILKQKSKVHWLQCGDGNNKYFHACLRKKTSYGQPGVKLSTVEEIKEEITDYYKYLLGTKANTDLVVHKSIVKQ